MELKEEEEKEGKVDSYRSVNPPPLSSRRADSEYGCPQSTTRRSKHHFQNSMHIFLMLGSVLTVWSIDLDT